MTDKRSPLDEDFFIPTPVSGSTIPVEEMSDLEYLKKSLFDALKIPKDNKKMNNKIRVTDEFGVIEDGMSLESIRDLCNAAINSTEWINCRLEVKWADCEYDADRYVIEGERWETAKEWSKRLKEEERTRLAKTKQKADKEAYERQQYERLKKKFEGK